MKDYLVILAGLPRGGEKTWQSLKSKVIDYLDADLAICTEKNIDKSLMIYKFADYLWLFDERKDWSTYYLEHYSHKAINILKKGEGAGLWESGVVHLAIKDIILKNYVDIIKKYKYVIYSRFDQFYTNYHPPLKGNNIWIPKGEDYFGINDRHAVLNTSYIEKYLDICSFIDNLDEEGLDEIYLNCETIYKMQLENYDLLDKVQRIKRFQFTSALESDFTRWRIPKYGMLLDKKLKIKYPDEFVEALKNINFLEYFKFKNYDLILTYKYLKLRRFLGSFKKY
tara:strand:- start:7475 stop:8320 length:846 start_codon:yes stop_codon:yes gene_type:complete